jgi:protein-S-isoprenylcysteine O-methyltransferase Ste14
MKDKVGLFFLLKKNFSLRLAIFYLVFFILMKFINPNWSITLEINSVFLNNILSYGGLALYLLGLILCIWARTKMKDTWTPAEQTTINHKKKLVKGGPFSFTRNPIYFGLIMIHAGFFIALKSYLLIMVLYMIWFFSKKAMEEEKILEKDFGSEYLKYKSKVPRFL